MISPSGSVAHVDRHRAVGVRADAEPVDVLAEIEVAILMAKDRKARLGHLGVAPGEFGNLMRPDVLMGQRQQRNVHPDECAEVGAPESAAGDDDVGGHGAGSWWSRR